LSRSRENSAFIALLLIILVVAPAFIYVYRSTHPPSAQPSAVFGDLQLQSTSVDMTGLSRNGIDLDLNAVVYNPNGFGATLASADYSAYANGHYLGEGHLTHAYDFTPGSSQTFSLPVNVGWKSAFLTTGSYVVGLGSITWRANGTADIEVGGFPLTISFDISTG